MKNITFPKCENCGKQLDYLGYSMCRECCPHLWTY